MIAVAVVASALSAEAEIRAFTNDNGTVIQAELVSHQGGKVTLKRADGKEFSVSPSIFSAEDEGYIAEWIKITPATQNYNFKITAEKKKVEGITRNFGYKRVKNETWSYLISITNNSQDPVSKLTINYRVFYTNSADGEYSDTSEGLGFKMIEASEKLNGELAFNRLLQITTKPVQIDVVDYDYGRRYRDELKGCLIRITNEAGDVVHDWCSAEVVMKGKTWANTGAASRGRDGGSVIIR